MKKIRGKRALVTGAASGIGRAIAIALAEEGADLFLIDIDEPRLAAVAEEIRSIGVDAIAHRCDVARPQEVSVAIRCLLDRWGALDILVNNAGVAYYGPTELMTPAQWDRLLSVNLLAPIQFTRELLPVLLTRPEAHILNIASLGGLIASGRLVAYHVTKFGLVGLSEALRVEQGPRGIGVTALCPGLVRTNLLKTAMTGRSGKSPPTPPHWVCSSAESVAKRAVRAIRRNEGVVVIGRIANLLWAVKRFVPGLLDFVQRFRRHRRRTESTPAIQTLGVPEPAAAMRKSA